MPPRYFYQLWVIYFQLNLFQNYFKTNYEKLNSVNCNGNHII
jgi:hypothetical protein